MADNVPITAGVGTTVSTEEVTTLNGGAVAAQHAQRMIVAVRTADVTAVDILGDVTNGLDVDVTRLPALATGANVIGALSANQSVNIAQINAVAPLMGNGVTGTGSQRVTVASDNTAFPVWIDERPALLFKGRASTFRTPGRAGTTGQKIFAIHNATGSARILYVSQLRVDLTMTVAKALTVLPPMVRAYRVTVLPTNGTAVTKVARDTTLSDSASVTVFQDANADGTSSASALTATLPAGNVLGGEFAPRFVGATGYETCDRIDLIDKPITLRALEGIVVMLDYVLATQNPITDMWAVTCEWDAI